MNSNLLFQKLLWYHRVYDFVYFILMVSGQLIRLNTMELDTMSYVVIAVLIIHIPMEYFRMSFGFQGNINETFPELIAFLIFTFCFSLPLSVVPIIQPVHVPHERSTCAIMIAFTASELIVGFFVMCQFMRTQSAAFYLRTAPLIDKTFMRKYFGSQDVGAKREI
jgi:hypothetical protein